MNAQNYSWVDTDEAKDKFLVSAIRRFDSDVKVFVHNDSKAVTRKSLDGLWLVKGIVDNSHVAFAWCDFRVQGASFGREMSVRFQAFLQQLNIEKIPLVFVVQTLGFRFMEGRLIFNDVFGVIPSLINYSKQNLLVTICNGKCLGIGAIFFSLGHYRIAADKDVRLSLTGPDVFNMFFGKKYDFDEHASAGALSKKSKLIHVIAEHIDVAVRNGMRIAAHISGPKRLPFFSESPKGNKLAIEFLQKITVRGVPLFPDYEDVLSVFILDLKGRYFAVLINPPGQANNMFNTRSLDLYKDALRLFSVLKLPLLVVLDTPGIDPRFDGYNQYIIEKLVDVTAAILEYPHKKIGMINGRAYGGAISLGIPLCYGAMACYAIKDKLNTDVMHQKIMGKLLEGSDSLLKQWEETQDKQDPECNDMVGAGLFTKIITIDEIPGIIQESFFND